MCLLLRLLLLCGALPLAGAVIAQPDPRDATLFEAWRASRTAEVAAYESFLRAEGLHELAPLYQLLRSASSWQDCAAEPFAIPPEERWPAVRGVLSLLRTLRERGVLRAPLEVHSTHRDEALNACAGGAPRSAHRLAYAVDLTLPGQSDAAEALCTFWREHGRDWRMGLGRYPSGRLHIDTLGWRSWGADGSSRSALCALEPAG